MTSDGYRFGDFSLDPSDRQLRRGGKPVELGGRYFDALELLLRDSGKLVSKDRFMGEVWRGVPVTDEALTQCIRTIRRQLGDEAARPRFIETVPKHGYRFIAPVEASPIVRGAPPPSSGRWRDIATVAAAGTVGGAIAGLLGGLFYGFAAAGSAIGSASAVLVLVSVTVLVALLGAGGVALGIAVAGARSAWAVAGGAAGGLIIGATVKLLAGDAFILLLGRSPGDVTGAPEGAVIGAALGLAAWLASLNREGSVERAAGAGALCGGAAGLLVPLLGGRMMAGSLDQLARTFPGSRLQLDQLGMMAGETGFGPIAQLITGGLEGALFGGCVVGAIIAARKRLAGQAV